MLPKCGIYRTTKTVAGVPAGRLVYFHNHGNPGPGVYLPETWQTNRARFAARGHMLAGDDEAEGLQALRSEGLYRVREAFSCCEKKCVTFAENMLVQLGYDGGGRAILFVPDWTSSGLRFPERGQATTDERLAALDPLTVAVARAPDEVPPEHLH